MSRPYENPVGSDPHCGACAHRVNAQLVSGSGSTLWVWMDCTHPAVGHKKCEYARDEAGACGPTATLYERHPGAPTEPAQGVLL